MPEAEVEFDPDLDEPKLLTFLRDYWHRRRGAASMPQRKDIAPSHMKAELDEWHDYRSTLVRLRFYYPGAYAALTGDDLKKRRMFEADEPNAH